MDDDEVSRILVEHSHVHLINETHTHTQGRHVVVLWTVKHDVASLAAVVTCAHESSTLVASTGATSTSGVQLRAPLFSRPTVTGHAPTIGWVSTITVTSLGMARLTVSVTDEQMFLVL